jgi:hypothetical protein
LKNVIIGFITSFGLSLKIEGKRPYLFLWDELANPPRGRYSKFLSLDNGRESTVNRALDGSIYPG